MKYKTFRIIPPNGHTREWKLKIPGLFGRRILMDLSSSYILKKTLNGGHKKIMITTTIPIDHPNKTLFCIRKVFGELWNWEVTNEPTSKLFLCDKEVKRYFGDSEILYINSI